MRCLFRISFPKLGDDDPEILMIGVTPEEWDERTGAGDNVPDPVVPDRLSLE